MNAPFPPLLFEIINCVIWTFALGVLLILSHYLAAVIWDTGGDVRAAWRQRDRMAVALWVTVLGIVVVRSWTWLGRYLLNIRADASWMAEPAWVIVPTLGCVIQAIGLCCLARVLTPDSWGRNGWRTCVLFSAAILAATYLAR